jgi:hypothetical protein
MAFSRTAPRHEISYLRRRPKPGEKPAAVPAPAAAAPALSLGRAPAQPSRQERPVARARGRAILSRSAPSVTLDRRQSAIGALVFSLVGAGELSCAWELVDGEAGLVSAAGGVNISPEFARRPIVQLREAAIVVGLRNVRRLRRLLLMATHLDAAKPSRIIGDLVDGATIESSHAAAGRPVVVALAVYGVDGELVIRLEDAPFASVEEAAAAYGFAPTWQPPVHR